MTYSTKTALRLMDAALLLAPLGLGLGCDGGEDTTTKAAGKSSLTVTPLTASLGVSESIAIGIKVQVPSSDGSVLVVESGEADVIAQPALTDFSEPLPNMAVQAPTKFFFSSSGGEDATSVNLTCKKVGFVPVTITVNPDAEALSQTVEITCTDQPPTGEPTHCIVPFANETVKGVDPDGKLVDIPSWGKGAAVAGAVAGAGVSTSLLMVGYAEGSEPAMWRSDAFDPSTGGPTTWEPFTVSGSTGQFGGVAVRGSDAVLASVDVGLYAFAGGVLSAADPTPASTLACDDAGACVTTDVNGGLLRTTDGVSWSPTNGSEHYAPLVHCDGAFMAYDFFNNQQLHSSDGLTWTPGDLSAFNVNSFTCGNGTWVASAQGSTWWSSDGGQTWTQSTDAVGMVSYSPTAQMFYAAGTGSTFFPTIWRSSDGDTWTETDNLGMAGALNNIVCY